MKSFIQKYSFYICMVVFAAAVLAAGTGYFRVGNILLLVSFTLYVCLYLYLLFTKKKFTVRTAGQMAVIHIIFCLFWDLALVHNFNDVIDWRYFIAGFIPLHLGLCYWLAMALQRFRLKYFVRWFKENYPLVALMVLLIAVTVGGLSNTLKWDELEYELSFTHLKNFNFSLYDIRLFSLCGHKTFGYTLLGGIGEFLFPVNGMGVRMAQIGMGLVTMLALNGILKNLLPKSGARGRFLLLLIFVFNPAFISNVTYISPDYAVACFFIWMVAGHLTGYKILQFFCNILLCFSKETGILVCFFYYAGYYLAEALREKRTGQRLKMFFFHYSAKEGFLVLFAPVAFLLYFLVSGTLWGGATQGYISGFRFEAPYLLDKFKALFLVNFNWILLLAFVFALIQYIRKKLALVQPSYLTGLLAAAVGFLGFAFSFVTYNHIRYNLVFYFIFMILTIYFLWNVQKTLCLWGCGLLGLLSLWQSFYTIDPVTRGLFRNLDLGNGHIITTREERYGSRDYDYSDSVVYNRQYSYVDKTIQAFLADIDYDGTQLLVFPNMTKAADVQATAYCFLGEFEPFCYNREPQGYWASYMDETTYPDVWPGENVYLDILFVNEEPEPLPLADYEEIYYVDQLCGYDFDSEKILNVYDAKLFQTYDYRTAKTVVYKIKG